jgi:glycosyltransferase involved in cell wall biosynthesis
VRKIVIKNDNHEFNLIERGWEEYHGITAAFIALDEEENIVDFLNHIKPLVDRIVMVDGGSKDKTVELAEPYVDMLKVVPFFGHFAEQKNIAMRNVYTDWTLFLDPDERLSEKLFKDIRNMIDQDVYDCYKFPRKQFIDGKEDTSVYPDFQARLFRTYCRFVRPIHEEVVGWKKCKDGSINTGMDVMHYKKEQRHKSRNACYPLFGMHYIHEWGKPGEQMEKTVVKPVNLVEE